MALAALLAAAAASRAQESIAWQGDFDAALAQAKAQQRPLLVAFIMDGEAANDETVRSHYRDPSIVELSRQMVCVVGNTGAHAADGPCPKFGTITCAQHRSVEIAARKRLLSADVVRAPQHVLCNALGVEILRKVYLIPIAELRKSMQIALGRTGADPRAGDAIAQEKARVDKLLEDADSRNAETRDAAFRGLAAADDERAIPALLERTRASNSKGVRYAAVKALGIKGNHKAIAPLVGLLRGSDAAMIAAALEALERIELPDPVPELLKLLQKDKRDRVRGRALRAIASCHPESAAVRQACLGAMRGASRQLVESALIALFDLAPGPDVAKAVLPHMAAKNQNTRALAIWVLGKQRDGAHLAALRALAAEDGAPEVRELAHSAADYCAGKDVDGYELLYTSFHWDEDF
jgi:HEAT repeat protein